jgi:hypothetical protein
MLAILIACSDPGCAEELELHVDAVEEIDRYGCECGYGYVVLAVSEVDLV